MKGRGQEMDVVGFQPMRSSLKTWTKIAYLRNRFDWRGAQTLNVFMNSLLMDDVFYLNESDIETNTCVRLQAEKMHEIDVGNKKVKIYWNNDGEQVFGK